LNILF